MSQQPNSGTAKVFNHTITVNADYGINACKSFDFVCKIAWKLLKN
jgi:hypothetical protein